MSETVIRALAEAFWPVSIAQTRHQQQCHRYPPQCNAASLVTTEASYHQITLDVNKVIDKRLYGPSQIKLRLLLHVLGYRLPMLLLAGRHCLSSSWPFVLSLPEMAVEQRQAMLRSWSKSLLADLRQAYKGVKAILSSVLMSFIDPDTHTNPFFADMGYVPGNAFSDSRVGQPAPGAAQQEEVLSSATVHLPDAAAAAGTAQALQGYLTKRGFHTSPAGAAEGGINGSPWHNGTNGCSNGSTNGSISSDGGSIHLYYDAVVVGSGAGGGVTAAVLAAAGLKVLVLEKSSWVRRAGMSWLEDQALGEMYDRAGFVTTEDDGMTILAGSTLGGGTKINWTASLRPPPHVRAEWAAPPHNLTHLAPDAAPFDAALTAVCTKLGVTTGTTRSTPNALLEAGLQQLGLHVEEYPRNCGSSVCTSYCNMGCRSGHKQSSEVWLADAAKAGGQLLTGVEVTRVLTEQAEPGSSHPLRAAGVVAFIQPSSSQQQGPDRDNSSSSSRPGLQLVVHAPIVVSSCGSIHTPALLLRSGITGGGCVGANLRLHPATGIVAVFPRTAEQAAAGKGAVGMYEGVSMGVFSRAAANWQAGGYGAFISVPACQPGLLAAICPDPRPGYLQGLMMALQDASLAVIFTRDSSSGRVSVDKQGRPVISYWPCETTRAHLIEGIITTVKAFAAAGAVRVVVPNAVEPWEVVLNPEDPLDARLQQVEGLAGTIRAAGIRKYDVPLFSAHQMGSCKMGSDSRSSVCDAEGQVWGVSGLYIADGSVFPTPSGVNPMITIYGIAHLTAQGIAAKWKQQQRKQLEQQQHCCQDGMPSDVAARDQCRQLV